MGLMVCTADSFDLGDYLDALKLRRMTNDKWQMPLFLTPAIAIMFKPYQVDHPVDNGHGNILDSFWLAVERRHGRANNSAGFGYCRHIADMNQIERGIPGNQDQSTSFFQYNVGGTGNQVVRYSAGYAA